MTQPTPPNRPNDRQFARDVARQLDRRRGRRRRTLGAALVALIGAAALYLRFGTGFGIGLGGGNGDGDTGRRSLAGPQRCQIRLSAGGITVRGQARSRDEAVAACRAAAGADVFVTGDARHGDREDLLAALRAAHVQDIALHEPTPEAGSAQRDPAPR